MEADLLGILAVHLALGHRQGAEHGDGLQPHAVGEVRCLDHPADVGKGPVHVAGLGAVHDHAAAPDAGVAGVRIQPQAPARQVQAGHVFGDLGQVRAGVHEGAQHHVAADAREAVQVGRAHGILVTWAG